MQQKCMLHLVNKTMWLGLFREKTLHTLQNENIWVVLKQDIKGYFTVTQVPLYCLRYIPKSNFDKKTQCHLNIFLSLRLYNNFFG